jgi:hypothetical protein
MCTHAPLRPSAPPHTTSWLQTCYYKTQTWVLTPNVICSVINQSRFVFEQTKIARRIGALVKGAVYWFGFGPRTSPLGAPPLSSLAHPIHPSPLSAILPLPFTAWNIPCLRCGRHSVPRHRPHVGWWWEHNAGSQTAVHRPRRTQTTRPHQLFCTRR